MNESWYDKLFFFPRKISVLKYVWSKPMNPTLKEYPGYAGFLKRFLAGIVDLIFLSVIVVSIITAYIIFEIAPNFNSSMHKIFSISFLWEPFFTSGVLCFLYFVALEASTFKGTIGKILTGIQVTDLMGNTPNLGSVLLRNIYKILSLLTLGFIFLIIGISPRKQGIHDFLAKTLVINKVEKQVNFKNIYTDSLNKLRQRIKK
jgi:uncharacterized RDD family membrane protein YckC